MLLRIITTILISLTCIAGGLTQETYQLGKSIDGADVYIQIYKGDIEIGDYELVCSINEDRFVLSPDQPDNKLVRNFEVLDENTILFAENYGDLWSYDIPSDVLTKLGDVTPHNTDLFYNLKNQIFGIRMISETTLYCSGNSYLTYNMITGEVNVILQPTSVGHSLTDSYRLITARATTIHNGETLFITNSRAPTSRISKLNYSDPGSSEVIQVFDSIGFASNPMVSLRDGCDSAKLYIANAIALGQDGWYEVNLETAEVTWRYPLLSFIPGQIGLPLRIKHYPAEEWNLCLRQVDLDEDDDTALELDYDQPLLCEYEDLPISDSDVKITNHVVLDSITIDIIDASDEQWLTGTSGATYSLTGESSAHMSIISSPATTTDDMERAVRLLRYHQTPDAGISEARIRVLGWFDGMHGDTAIATLQVPPSLPDAGSDLSHAYCTADSSVVLHDIMDGQSGGVWYDTDYNRLTPASIDLSLQDSLEMYYIISFNGCADTSSHDITISAPPVLVPLADLTLCADDPLIVDLSGDGHSVLWDDGSSEIIRSLDRSGSYGYTVTTLAGCEAYNQFTLDYTEPTELRASEATICMGDSRPWRQRELTTTGLYADTLLSLRGCDSIIHTMDLLVLTPDQLVIDYPEQLCEGQSASLTVLSDHTDMSIDGFTITSPVDLLAGDYFIQAYDRNGCAVLDSLTIRNIPSPEVTLPLTFDTVYHDGIQITPTYSDDVSSISWSPAELLSCSRCPEPTLIEQDQSSISVVVSNEAGCIDSAQMLITYRPPDLYVANVVNSTSQYIENKVVYLQTRHDLPYSLEIYDRWGNKVYHGTDLPANDPSYGWAVTPEVQTGVYVYKLTVGEQLLAGDVTVLH